MVFKKIYSICNDLLLPLLKIHFLSIMSIVSNLGYVECICERNIANDRNCKTVQQKTRKRN